MTINTLKYAEDLEAAGEKPAVAKAHANHLKGVLDDSMPTKDWIGARFAEIAAMFFAQDLRFEKRIKKAEDRQQDAMEALNKDLAGYQVDNARSFATLKVMCGISIALLSTMVGAIIFLANQHIN